MFKRNVPNMLSVIRIVVSMFLLLTNIETKYFLTLYLIAGISDVLDGYIARKINCTSEFGSILDTVGDIFLVLVIIQKIYPYLDSYFSLWLVIIFIIKLVTIVYGLVIRKEFVSYHSLLNKISGVSLFSILLLMKIININYLFIIVLILTTISAVDEFVNNVKKRNRVI